MRPELQPALALARTLAQEQLAAFVGELEEIKATALARLTAPVVVQASPDEQLEVPEAAARLGVSVSYLYHNSSSKFRHLVKREGRKLLFSARGIEAHIARKLR